MHVGIAGYLLGEASGANHRLLGLLRATLDLLGGDEHVTVLVRPGFAPPFEHPRLRWHPFAVPTGALRRCFAERRLARLLQSLRIGCFEHGMLPAPRIDGPLLFTVHDVRHRDGHGGWPNWLAERALRAACARAAAVITPSRFTADALRGLCASQRLHVIPNGIDPDAAPTLTAPAHLLHIGHLEPRKNLAVLVRAYATARRALADTPLPQLVLAGADAGEQHRLQQLAHREGVATFVTFCGAVDEARLRELLVGAQALLLPSVHEGFGMPLLEAMAAGVPCVISDRGALPEVAGGCARIVAASDVAGWARAMLDAEQLPRPDRVAIARAQQFTWRAAAAQNVALWRSLAQR